MKKKKKVRSKKGFTLIELLGTIVIIGILGTIAITSVVNIKKSTNSRFDNSQVELMKQAGQTYFTDNKRLLPIVEGQTNFVTLDELIEKGYINKLYNSKKEEFDAKDSYVWVQKQDNGSYKYDCYCTINGTTLAGTTIIPKSEVNNTTITFEYIGGFYDVNKRHYTNGKSDAKVRVSLIREEVSKYKYEIYKKLSTGEDGYVQYKISQRDQLTDSTVDIQLKSKDYSEGEYFVLVTAYNKSGRASQSIYSDGIYVDKTPPTCNITTDYKIDESSKQSLWYNSKSKNSSNQALGIDQELPIVASGSDEGSGVNESTKHIFSDRSHFNKLDNDNGTYNAGNTGKNGKEYYATIEDYVGNKASCSQLYYIDTTPPTCSDKGIKTGTKGNKVGNKQWYLTNVQTYGYFTDENSGITDEEQLSDILKNTKKDAQTSTITRKDNAGNEGSCVITDIYIDKENPTCTSSGGSSTWKNATSDKKTTLKGTCSDVGSGCVEGSESGRRYDRDGNVYWDITWEGSWTKLTPGTVYDEAGRSTTCPGNQTVKHDWTAPTCKVVPNGTPGENGWYKSAVSFTVDATSDETNGSGIGYSSPPNSVDNIWNTTVYGTITDSAGNTSESCSKTVSSDSIAPTIDGCCGYNARKYNGYDYSDYAFACTNDGGTVRTINGVSPFIFDYGPSGIADGSVTFYVYNIAGIQIAKDNGQTRQIINGKRHFCIQTSEGTYESAEKQTYIQVVGLKDNAGNEASSGWIACNGRSTNDPKYSGCTDWRETHKCTNKTDDGFVCNQPGDGKTKDNSNTKTVKGV